MEVHHSIQALLGIIQIPISLINLIKEHNKLRVELRSGLRSIKQRLEMIKGDTESYDELELQELVYDIEDFIHGIWVPGASGPILTAIGMNPCFEDLERIKHFKECIQDLKTKRQQERSEPVDSPRSSPPVYTREEDLVGIAKAKTDVLELLSAAEQQLRVISILGVRGVGKTALARAVYDYYCRASRDFDCVAWVVASECSYTEELLSKILETVVSKAASANLHDALANKRYLVFIDGMQRAEMLKDTIHAFPKNAKSSRIVVTTSIHSVAVACSSGSYVYTMGCLGEADSKDLFWRNVYGYETKPAGSLVLGSKSIFVKCSGLPLALTSIAKYLSIKGNNLRRGDCEEASQTLGSDYLSGMKAERAFSELRKTLVQCYDSLPKYGHKTCFLSLSMFPRGHQINSNSLARRLLAEGLVAGDGRRCFEELIDMSIIEQVLVRKDSKVHTRCQVHSILLEFTIQLAVSKNFVSLIRGVHEPLRIVGSSAARVRRLCIQSSTKLRCDEVAVEVDLSTVRSLTILYSELFDFQSCKMLRLLDLEGCRGLDKKILEGICELLFLKYLSLRNSRVDKLPAKIKKLHCLETLDIRETGVGRLPVEVIMLPKLAYLFGKFELPDIREVSETVHQFLSKKSVLRTVAGFIVSSRTRSFEWFILEARKLEKVKVWCKDTLSPATSSTPASASVPTLLLPLQSDNNIELGPCFPKRFTSLDYVSIDSSGLCKGFLDSLDGPCTISSVKLRGQLYNLPDSIKLSLCNLTKLQLFSTGLSCQALCSLQSLCCLEYLKLVEDRLDFWDGRFVIDNDGFESLHRFCLEAPKLPIIQFKEGAMRSLTSLMLLCPSSSSTIYFFRTSQMQVTQEIEYTLGVAGISHLGKLNEVILHYSANKDKMEAWKIAANGHPNRPCVKKQPKPAANTAI